MSGGNYVDVLSPGARAVQEMFGYEGNTEDYWLGTPYDHPTEKGWRSANSLVRDMRRQEQDEWTTRKFRIGNSLESRESIEMMTREEPNAHDRAGGLTGIDTTMYYRVRAGLIALGEQGEGY